MILQSWAEHLLNARSSPDVIDLHVKDTLAAFLAGVRTKEGQALSELYGRRADPAELAAAAAAIARLSECDDIHLASCVTPGSVVIPVALALAGNRGEDDFNRAVAAGYAAGLAPRHWNWRRKGTCGRRMAHTPCRPADGRRHRIVP